MTCRTGHPGGFDQGAVMSLELYSRIFSKTGCTMSTVEEGTTILLPHVPPNMPQGWEVGNIPGGDPRQPFSECRGKTWALQSDTWVRTLAPSFTCCVMSCK